MPIAVPTFVRTGDEGYGLHQQLPIEGGTPPPKEAVGNKDALSQWMQAQPWYQQALRQWGMSPTDVHLSGDQRIQLSDAASRAASGESGGLQVDGHGALVDVSMPTWVKIALIATAAGAGAAALAPILAGGAGAAGVGAGTGVGIGETGATVGLASGAGLPGAVSAGSILGTAGGVGTAGSLGAGTGVGLGETAATTGLASGAGLPGATALPSSLLGTAGVGIGETAAVTGLPEGAATITGSGAVLPSSTIAPTMGTLAPDVTPGILNTAGAGSAGGILSSLKDPATIAKLGTILGQAAASQQASKALDDRAALSLFGEQASAENAAKRFALTAPGSRLKQSVGASLINNYQPQSLSWGGPGSGLRGEMPTYRGGVPGGMANLDPQTKSLSQQVMKDQLLAQMNGGASGGNDDRAIPPVPKVGDANEDSTWEKLLGGAALGTSIYGALGK